MNFLIEVLLCNFVLPVEVQKLFDGKGVTFALGKNLVSLFKEA